jgi:site-specific recombinase XerD
VLFDWLVVGHVLDVDPAHSVRGPKHVVKKGKTPVLTGEETRLLLDSIDIESLVGLRDRALIGLMTYSFASVGAVLKMQVRDYFVQGKRGHVRLHEKGGKEHEAPCHYELEEFLDQYISIASIGKDLIGPLFHTSTGRSGTLNSTAMYQQDVFRMIRRRAAQAEIETLIGNHTFRATGVTAYLKNGGSLEIAQHIANHESPRTTKLYDRRVEEISQSEVERIRL